MSPITPSSCLCSRCLALFCLPLSLHLVSHYPFILSLIIPPSCPIILSLPMFFDHVLSVVKSFLTFVAVGWVAKLGYIIVLLCVLVLVHPSYWKSHIPQQGTREDSNPKGGGTPLPPLKRNSVLLAPKISETVTGPIQQINCTKVHKTQLASATFRQMQCEQQCQWKENKTVSSWLFLISWAKFVILSKRHRNSAVTWRCCGNNWWRTTHVAFNYSWCFQGVCLICQKEWDIICAYNINRYWYIEK